MLKFLPLNLQFFADGGEGTDEGDQQADNQAGGNNQQQDQTQDKSGTNSQQSEDKTFSQEDVNNLVARETKKQQEKLLKQLGVNEFKDAKEGMKQFKEWQESQKTEQEKLNEKLTTFESQINEKDATISDLQAENEAIKAGITDEKNLEAVITLAKTKVNDDVDIKEAIKQVVEDYPHFAGKQDEEESKPSFTTAKHQQQGKLDAFAQTLLGK
ncbi:hypothetical protein [Virgibacillus sp. Bac332]|uniref:hypothetical protein n=1 Tax=Virgibacillus sp. Bac332 TaxID=2419842 RepID=UPI000EF4BA8D|nr:hypothetical protein [Virgibacillus sp. Bac332]